MICPTYHIPVLLRESVDGLLPTEDGIYVDVTFGGGGHSREIIRRLGKDGHLYSFDQDADAEANVPAGEGRLTFVRSNFRYLTNWMRYYGAVGKVDGILGGIFEFYLKHPWELPQDYTQIAARDGLERAVCDYVSGMTDGYAIEKFGEIFIPAAWSVK